MVHIFPKFFSGITPIPGNLEMIAGQNKEQRHMEGENHIPFQYTKRRCMTNNDEKDGNSFCDINPLDSLRFSYYGVFIGHILFPFIFFSKYRLPDEWDKSILEFNFLPPVDANSDNPFLIERLTSCSTFFLLIIQIS